MDDSQIVLMFSVGRTGSTWISSLMGTHPGLVDACETNFFADTSNEVMVLGRYNPVSLIRSFMTGNALVPIPVAGLKPDDVTAILRRHVLDIYGTYLRNLGRWDALVLDKSPAHMLSQNSIRSLRRTLPMARVVHLVRDLRDVFSSYAKKYPEYWLMRAGVGGFCDVIDRVYGTFLEEYRDFPTMRYEDVMANPEAEICHIMERLHLDTSDPTFRSGLRDVGGPTSDWRTELSEEDAATITGRLGWILRRWGYETE